MERRVASGRISNPAKIGVAADRIFRDSGVARCFMTAIKEGFFSALQAKVLKVFGVRMSRVPIAVGTALAGGPPHRSERAELPHSAPTSGSSDKAQLRVRMQDLGRREPSGCEPVHSRPVDPSPLAPAPQRLVPVASHLRPKG